MAGNPFFQDLDPDAVPDSVTPSEGDPSRPPAIPADEIGNAPYDISAPQDIAGIGAACAAAGALTGAGVVYPPGPRQAETRDGILDTPQGAMASNVFAGFPDYENQDLRPPGELPTPIQGEMGQYPVSNTYQPGIAQFTAGLGAGVEGVPPETEAMGAGPATEYPGTTQSGLPVYGGK